MLELLRRRPKVVDCQGVVTSVVQNDRELLVRFLAGDEAAFSELVQRHAGLVWGTCRRVLRNAEDADDAFQATFLVLARKARSLQWQESIAGWLLETARRTSLKLRAVIARRRKVEDLSAQQREKETSTSVDSPAVQASVQELTEILDAELAGLPARFREVIVLSQVEGLTRDELAERLGISIAAVKDRLERGREQLRLRMLRRGVTLTAATLSVWLAPGTASAAGMTTLVASIAQNAGAFAATGSLVTGTTPVAASLAQGILKMMGLEKMKYISICIVSLLTAGGIAYGMLQDEPTRFEKGLRGNIVAVNVGKPATVTISLEGFDTLLNLDVSSSAKVWTAFEVGQFSDLKEGNSSRCV
jgi:RNA polymerase sigma factor (sigma-70 family)